MIFEYDYSKTRVISKVYKQAFKYLSVSNYTSEEFSQILENNNRILAELETLENQGWDKKKDKIANYIDNSRILLSAGKLPIVKKQFASYMYAKLSERITIHRNGGFYGLFKDDESISEMSRIVDKESTNISSVQTGKTVDQVFRDSVLKPKKDNKYTRHFENLIFGAKEIEALSNAMLEKYNESEELAKIMEDHIDLETTDIISIISTISLARKQIDDRNKWGNYEKLIAQFLINVGETKAELAKKLNYCSKYASIGIERNEELTRYWHFLGKCLHCGTDIKDEKDLMIEKYLNGEELGITSGILKGY